MIGSSIGGSVGGILLLGISLGSYYIGRRKARAPSLTLSSGLNNNTRGGSQNEYGYELQAHFKRVFEISGGTPEPRELEDNQRFVELSSGERAVELIGDAPRIEELDAGSVHVVSPVDTMISPIETLVSPIEMDQPEIGGERGEDFSTRRESGFQIGVAELPGDDMPQRDRGILMWRVL